MRRIVVLLAVIAVIAVMLMPAASAHGGYDYRTQMTACAGWRHYHVNTDGTLVVQRNWTETLPDGRLFHTNSLYTRDGSRYKFVQHTQILCGYGGAM